MYKYLFLLLVSIISLPVFATPEEADSVCSATQLPPFYPIDLRGLSTCPEPNNFQSLNCGSTVYLDGHDKLYRITPLVTRQVDLFLINPKDVYNNPFPEESLSLFVLDNCPSQNAQCVDYAEGEHLVKLTNVVLYANVTYYILISSQEKCIDYSLLIKTSPIYPIDNLVPDPGLDFTTENECNHQPVGSTLANYSNSWSTPNDGSY